MTIGTGIFLSSVVLSLVIIFISTKDRWNWKRIILWPTIVLLILAVLGGIGAYVYSNISKRPHIADSFWDISLNKKMADIKFLKGEPTRIDKDNWFYEFKESNVADSDYTYGVAFRGDKIRSVLYFGPSSFYDPQLQDIKLNDPVEKIESKFGKPSHVSISKDQLMRMYSYSNYHVCFLLGQGKFLILLLDQ